MVSALIGDQLEAELRMMSSLVQVSSPRCTASDSIRGWTLNCVRTWTAGKDRMGWSEAAGAGGRARRGAPAFTRRIKSITSRLWGWNTTTTSSSFSWETGVSLAFERSHGY